MKTRLIIAVMILGLVASAQTTKRTLLKAKFGGVKLEHIQKVTGSDTLDYVVFIFRNAKYQHLIDYKVIILNRNSDIDVLANQMQWGVDNLESGTVGDYGRVHIYDFARQIYLYEDRGNTIISIRNAKKIILWLNAIELEN